jgi:CHAT domain-containing protein
MARHRAREDVVRSTMEWLWDAIAEPVLTELGFDGPVPPEEQPPRLWWCPTGVLSLLPLHGAGYHDGSGRTAVDRVISSSTPTLRALLEARQPVGLEGQRVQPEGQQVQPEGQPRLLVVAVPEQPGMVELSAVDREGELLARLFKGHCEVLSEDEATTRAVLDAMTTHPWVHFGCHGFQNLEDPSQAGLLLSDGTLRVTEIGARRFRGDLALLLSCQSATGGANLPDEVITLAAALHYTGYRHVIGTLSTVDDDIAADVSAAFYDEMSARQFDADVAATALHHAVAQVRQRLDLPLVSWLPYTHIGP